MKKTVRAPGSSANLGPGFDTLALALEVYLECDFEPAPELRIEVAGRDCAGIASDASNLIWKTMAAYGSPPVALSIRNGIPLGKGMGSSAAAITAGVVIANELLGWNWPRSQVLNETARLEGHPDNVSACVWGGLTASAVGEDGRARTLRLDLPPGVEVALVVPGFALATSKARAALPECYTREDAIYNLQRVALLVAALAKGSREEFAACLGDRFHQPYRAPLIPGLAEILSLRLPGLLGCVLSGAGPSVLAFLETGARECCGRIVAAFASHGYPAEVLPAGVAKEGFQVF